DQQSIAIAAVVSSQLPAEEARYFVRYFLFHPGRGFGCCFLSVRRVAEAEIVLDCSLHTGHWQLQ
ncbi:MAG TPA: hypothetical protein VKV05_13815, partial [Terriglobales bacterium]|nr:hypothetical protein [Terriglobales bacterium]